MLEVDKKRPREGLCRMCLRLKSIFFSSRRRHTRFDCDWSSDRVLFRSEEFALRPEAAGAEAEDSHDPQRDQEEYGQPQTGWAEQQRAPLTLFHARAPRRAGSECARNRDYYGAAFTSSQMEVMKPRCSSVSVWQKMVRRGAHPRA